MASDLDPAMHTAMDRVAALLDERCAGKGPFQEIARHVFARPGKRIRARLAVACAGLEGISSAMERDAIEGAAAVEVLHEASLVHDDICDAATERRGAPSVAAAFGIRAAGLTGAFLAGHALALLGGVLERRGEQLELARLTGLIEGQLLECIPPGVSPRDVGRRYERVAAGKTGVLFRFACELGALLGRSPAAAREAVDGFASELAIGFQVLDDVRDLEHPVDLGKPACNDLACGVVTWPVLNWLESVVDPVAALQRVVRRPKGAEEIEALRRIIVRSGATERARRFARAHLDAACTKLAELPSGWGRQNLEAVVTLVERL
jgi:geranylgeranyl pyrophosphate synthase